jgi:hypothetical protein
VSLDRLSRLEETEKEESGEFYSNDFSEDGGGERLPGSAINAPVGVQSKGYVSLGLAGLLSVRMNIPLSGKDYLFSKKIVEQEDFLHLNFIYVNEWIINGLLIILGLIILYIFFKMRKIFLRPVRALGKAISKLFPSVKKCFQPKIFPIVILVVFAATKLLDKLFYLYNYFPLLPVGLALLFIISLLRLFKKQIIIVIKFLCRPAISILVISAWIFFLLVTRLFIPFFPLFALLFIGLIVSVIRLIVRFLRKRKETKEVEVEEANKEIKE